MYDYDWAMRDDFIGEATVPLAYLEFDKPTVKMVNLLDLGKADYLGQISLELRIVAKAQTGEDRVGVATPLTGNLKTRKQEAGDQGSGGSGGHGLTPPPSLSGALEGPGGSSIDNMSITSYGMVQKKLKTQHWMAVVNIVLIEGKDMLAMDIEGTSDPYCKFRYLCGPRSEEFFYKSYLYELFDRKFGCFNIKSFFE